MNIMVQFLWRRRTAFMTMLGILVLVVGRPVPRYTVIGVPLVIIGQAIRLLAAGYLSKDNELVTAGPYSLCRNPLYLGSFLIFCGYLAIFGRADIFAIGFVIFWAFHGGAIAFEESKLRNTFGAVYEEYVSRVPRLLPKLRPSIGNGAFSWDRVVSNREHRTAFLNLVLSTMLVVNALTVHISPLAYLIALGR